MTFCRQVGRTLPRTSFDVLRKEKGLIQQETFETECNTAHHSRPDIRQDKTPGQLIILFLPFGEMFMQTNNNNPRTSLTNVFKVKVKVIGMSMSIE